VTLPLPPAGLPPAGLPPAGLPPAGQHPLFSGVSLSTRINLLLADAEIPPDHHVAVIAVADAEGARAVIVGRLGTHWAIQGSVEHAWGTGTPTTRLAVKASW